MKAPFYEEAITQFYGEMKLGGSPIASLDFYASFFDSISRNMQDITNLSSLSKQGKWKVIFPFHQEIMDKNHTVVVTDADINIVYATQNMYFMNGYKPEEIIGEKPKIFQGKDTCPKTTQVISKAIKSRTPFEVVLVNYKKNGAPYQCKIKGAPIWDKDGKLVNFIAFEKEVA
ncbi:PAS domain-containing protein [Muricauda sp. CAU 1633]|uniref:PAS domain-containing protein n=1 Tax=Allomuricauda sp. CAU 1633 TaxID=2816036 RepID=UPI001A9061FA|nr:PAS domain-containing protein [Muricauda sp. CAU 1633]MBO0321121.1 PAS domain-containing protein [Muricauda sp. CAU 1633]